MHRKGFTIVELLIVIVVIAILAAITIVAFSAIRQRASVSAASSMSSSAQRLLMKYQVENGGFPVTGNLQAAGVSDSNDVTYQYTGTANGFCLTTTKGSVSVKVTESTSPTQGGCTGHGQGGVAPVTNYATNPSAEINTGWLSNNGSVYPRSISSTVKRSGSYSIESHNVGASTSLLSLYGAGANNGNGFSVEPNKTYTASFYFRADVPHQGRIGISYRVGGVFQTTTYSAYASGSVGEWTRVSHTSTSPAGADAARSIVVVMSNTTEPANTSAWADDFMMVEGAVTPGYADGDSADWLWNGPPHASTSTGPSL